MNLSIRVDIAQPVEKVFARFADLERSPEWAAPVIERRQLTDGPVAVGTKFHAIDQFPGRRVEFTVEITEFEENQRIAAAWHEPMSGGWDAASSAIDGGTRLDMNAEMNPTGLMGLVFPLLQGWAKKQLTRDLEAFKAMLEHESSR